MMKDTRGTALVCLLMFTATIGCEQNVAKADEYRHWTTSKGKRSDVRLALVKRDGDRVHLKREDTGKIVELPLRQLSESDQSFVTRSSGSPATRQSVTTSDWPQWRGPGRDGKSSATGLASQWPEDGPRLLWNITGLGEGYSTPAVVGNMIYLLGTKDNEEYLFALAADDGGELWSTRLGEKTDGGGFPGPKGTPSVDGDLIYALGGSGALVCVRRGNGDVVWSKDLISDFGGRVGGWKYAESPLIDGDKLICTPGGPDNTIVALDKTDGSTIWKSSVGQTAAYASTIATEILGTRQYIAFLHGGVVGIEASNGNLLWNYNAPANGTANCSTPVALGNSVFAASAYGTGGGRTTISRSGNEWNASEDYFVKNMESHHGGFILHDGHIYGTNNSVLMCLEWETGQVKWQNRSVGKGSISMADGHLYVRGERGDVALVEATPDEYREKGRFSQPDRSDKNAWAYPVVAGSRLYLHDQDRLLCYDLQ